MIFNNKGIVKAKNQFIIRDSIIYENEQVEATACNYTGGVWINGELIEKQIFLDNFEVIKNYKVNKR